MKKAIIAVLLTVAITITTACGSTSLSSDDDSATSDTEEAQESVSEERTETISEDVIEYSADDILDMLDKNPLSASRTLKDKMIFLTGKISEIDADGEYIKLSGMMGYVNDIKCLIKSNGQLDYIARLSKNEGVRVLGRVTEVNGESGYSVEINEIEKYKPYRWFTTNDSNCDYSEYEEYPFIEGGSIMFPQYWKEYIEIEQETQYYFVFDRSDNNDIQSSCLITFNPCDDIELSDLAEDLGVENLSVSDDESKFDLLSKIKVFYEKAINSSMESQGIADTTYTMESIYLYINDYPALKMSSDNDSGYFEMVFVVFPNVIAMVTAGFPSQDEYHAEELFNSLLSVK